MFELDLWTAVVAFNMTSFIVTLIMYIVWRSNKDQFKGIGVWLIGISVFFLGIMLSSSQWFLPEILAPWLSNIIMMIGIFVFLMGTTIYLNKKFLMIPNIIIVLSFIFCYTFYGLITPNVKIRMLFAQIVFVLFFIQIIMCVTYKLDKVTCFQVRGIRRSAFLLTAISVVKFINVLITPERDSYYLYNTSESYFVLLTMGATVLLIFGIIIAINENLNEKAISNLKDKEEAFLLLEEQASLDGLTKVYNRMKMDQLLNQEISFSKRHERLFSIIMIDVDFFKAVNDTHGHQVGDTVLVELTDIIHQNLRIEDYIGRWGGEEFLVVLKELTINEAEDVAEKLRFLIDSNLFDIVGHITISLGVATYAKGDSIEKLVKKSDDALYEAKDAGRNKVRVSI